MTCASSCCRWSSNRGNTTDIQVAVNGMNTDGKLIVTYYVIINFYVYEIDGRVGAVKTPRFTI